MDNSKTVLILGSGSDMAKMIAREFAKHTYAVLLAGRNPEQMDILRKDLTSRYDIESTTHYFDATDFNSHATFVSKLSALPDIVIYTAGSMSEQEDAQKNWTLSKSMIDVNYIGAVSILNQFARLFSERRSGCIIGISSVAGDRGRGSNYIYGSTKAGLTAYLSGLRNELHKKNIQVITVKPGFVYTKMTQHLSLPPMLTAQSGRVADAIYNAVLKKKDVIYVKPLWRWIMQIIKVVPETVFKRTNL